MAIWSNNSMKGHLFAVIQYGLISVSVFTLITAIRSYNDIVDVHHSGKSQPVRPGHGTIMPGTNDSQQLATTTPPICPYEPPGLVGVIPVNLTAPKSIHEIGSLSSSQPPVELRGRWSPAHCIARCRLAVVVSYRNRTKNLKLFMQHMHPFLQKQQIEYHFFVIEPQANDTFNRGILKNIGFVEAMHAGKFDCVVFHDIDLLPLNDQNLYRCDHSPKHLVIAIDTNHFRALYHGAIFGGAVMFQPEHFLKANGYSNLYFNWGAEDDDLLSRTRLNHMRVHRGKTFVGRYIEAKHEKDKNRPYMNKKLFKRRSGRVEKDGLSSLNYTVLDRKLYPAYTWISVTYNETHYQQQIAKVFEGS